MRTSLYEEHRRLNARIDNFNGWEMPIVYTKILEEHHAVRNAVGIFDVSHMGRICIEGEDAEEFIHFLSTNSVLGKKNTTATYTILTNPQGGCLDDIIVYKIDPFNFFITVNAGNREKDLAHLNLYAANFSVSITPKYLEEGILALQGPHSLSLMQQLFPDVEHLKPFHFLKTSYNQHPLYLSYTGYTGEKGVEIYASNAVILDLWKELLTIGQKFGIQPIGLGARDTLRLEMGYALYSHELTDSILASESISAWTIKNHSHHFLGKEYLEKLELSPDKRYSYGIMMQEKGIPREGYEVFYQDKVIGSVTSGTHSPTLNRGIGLILVSQQLDTTDELEIKIRDKKLAARIHPLPFIPKPTI